MKINPNSCIERALNPNFVKHLFFNKRENCAQQKAVENFVCVLVAPIVCRFLCNIGIVAEWVD